MPRIAALILFGVFVAAGLAYLFLLDRVRTRREARHPDTFQTLAAKARPNRLNPMNNAAARFVWKRADRGLGDARLTALTRACLGLMWVNMLMFIPWCAVVFMQMHGG